MRFLLLIFIIMLNSTIVFGQGEMAQSKGLGLKNTDAKALILDSGDLYLATRNTLYKAPSANGQWQSVFYIGPGDNEITCLGSLSKNLFIGTRQGLFRSSDQGSHWQKVFRAIMPARNNIRCISCSARPFTEILIGTEAGIFVSYDLGKSWTNISGVLKNRVVRCAVRLKDRIYAGGDFGIYMKKDPEKAWERIIIKSPSEGAEPSDDDDTEEAGGEEGQAGGINYIGVIGSRLYVGFDKRIVYSEDGGVQWRDFPAEGLLGEVADILTLKEGDLLYCATTKGVFSYSKDAARWSEIYSGLPKRANVRKIVSDEEEKGKLWAVTDRGLYMLEDVQYGPGNRVDVEQGLRTFTIISSGEPTYRQLQQAAIQFCDVSPEKIASWQRQSRMKALLPRVSFGTDEGRSTNAEIYTSATRDYVTVGPDDIRSGWDFSVSWELGDLIWSDDQTGIDVRSRLTTQLRNDILDDLRRLYYERKRLQFELVAQPPQDAKLRFDRQMRLEELTHAIDDLTGNYLSANMKNSER